MENPDVLAVAETWLDNTITDAEIMDPSYILFRRDRNRHGGGVLIAAKDFLNPIRATKFEDNNIELVSVELSTRRGKILYCCLYYQKKPDIAFFNKLDNCVNKILSSVHSYACVILAGDFNVDAPHFQPGSKTFSEGDTRLYKLLTESLDPLNMTQLVDFVTRKFSDNQLDGTLIDHLYTNNTDSVLNIRPHHAIGATDHSGIAFSLNFAKIKQNFPPGTFLQYSKADLTGLCNELHVTDWYELLHGKNINEAWSVFKDKYTECIHTFVPSKRSRRREKKPWINDEIIKLAKKKKRLYRKCKKSPDDLPKWQNYKKCRNMLKVVINREYHSYVSDIANDNSNHGKKFWSFVRASKAKPTATSFKIDDICVTDPNTIANSFNEFFVSNFTTSDEPDTIDSMCEGHQGIPFCPGVDQFL
ncbi:uncharacterized protein [Amphiura filiformis]|uniref:uncharacterized protein n=1 Tax=Amphiura filiformis TaxID=82378 RepID=UPI003B211169